MPRGGILIAMSQGSNFSEFIESESDEIFDHEFSEREGDIEDRILNDEDNTGSMQDDFSDRISTSTKKVGS